MGAIRRLPGTAAEAEARRLKRSSRASRLACLPMSVWCFGRPVAPRVLVLATHGFFRPSGEESENPRFVRWLAGRTGCIRQAGEDRRVDRARQLPVPTRGTELVVLIRLRNGAGRRPTGEGVAGLRQAFHLAGARSVVASLWQVPDRAHTAVDGRIYRPSAKDRIRSMRCEMQLAMIQARREKGGAAHPFFWAAFTITGQSPTR